jgi:phage recombination protein Bet
LNDPYWSALVAPVMRNDMNAVVAEQKEPQLPAPVARRGITEAEWRTLANNLYPGAAPESVLMVWDYCKARKLDPLKKPCHIVPMQVRDARSGDYNWRDVVMPGIYEYRTTATRTGLYMGHSKPDYGPEIDHLGVKAPEWCDLTIYRWNKEAQSRCEYPVRVLFREIAATKKDKKTGELHVNDRWTKAPVQMLTKCTEAAGLREAFPDELGGTHTVEEMEGRVIDSTAIEIDQKRVDPRGDLSGVDWELRDKHVSAIADILSIDKEEIEISRALNEYVNEFLQPFPELYIAVNDKLAADGIISKKNFKAYLEKAGRHAA